MILLRILFVLTLSHCYLAQSQTKTTMAILGRDASLSCPWIWTWRQDLGVIVSLNNKRIGAWNAAGTYTTLDKSETAGFQVKPKAEPKRFSFTLTIPEVSLADDKRTLTCEGFGLNGMGTSTGSYSVSLRVIDPPKIVTKFDTEQSRLRGSTQSVEVDCLATGNPKPAVTWSKTDGSKIKTLDIAGGQRLILPAPISDNLDGKYICSAVLPKEFAGVPGVTSASRQLTFAVHYKPELVFEKKLVRTDLGTRETLKIEATGNPQPKVTCAVLSLPEPKLVRFTPQPGHKVIYEVTLQSVRKKDIRQYDCEAANSVGKVKDAVTLTLAPSVPKVLSSNSTIYSDYYELHWEVKSKAPISNVTVEVHVKGNKNKNGSNPLRTEVFQLKSDRRAFRHHIANLTHGTQHELRLRACNSRACSPAKAVAAFKTQSFDGTNTVDPKILVTDITEPPAAAASKEFYYNRAPCAKCSGANKGGMASSLAPASLAILLGALASLMAQIGGGR